MTPSVVAGAAIVRHGRVLAARRTHPPRLAGGWELPGGKVEPGETAEQACVREVREEMGCDVRIVERMPGEWPLDAGWALQVFACELVAGEPVPSEHGAVRWLGPEELEEVPWLSGDLPLLPALRERLLDGDPMPGNVGGSVRIGPTVRRPTGPWTPAVHALLGHLAGADLDGVPRVLGTDARGREVLTYLPGWSVDVDTEVVSDALLGQAVRWLRRMHAAVAEYRPAGASWRGVSRDLRPGEIVCHSDAGAYNWVVQGDRFVGLVDWDMAGPGSPLDDLAFMAWSSVPLALELPVEDVTRRLSLMAAEYGGTEPVELLDAVGRRMRSAAERIEAGQAAGDPGMLNLRRVGEPDRTLARLAALSERVPAIRAALR